MINTIKKLISSIMIETEIVSPFTKDLSQKVVVITGGTGKIGSSIARSLKREGACVINLSRTIHISKYFDDSFSIDITQRQKVQTVVEEIIKKYGKIDVLINNAGIFMDKKFENITETEFHTVIDTNLHGPFNMTSAVLPFMKKRKSGLVINIGSKISHNSNISPNKVLYATSKFALEGFSIALSKELFGTGVRVTCLMLGTANTFVSLKSKEYLVPENVGFIISMIMKCKDIDFESILIKSTKQKI